VLMREGTRTVLSMANNYQGPPENFAMVVPVPVVLQKENVKTLPASVFEHIDQLSSPRLVEYWEEDPCPSEGGIMGGRASAAGIAPPKAAAMMEADRERARPTVKIEAQFVVGEYDVVILSAEDSMGLDTWLREQKYNIPAGAQPFLQPYVQAGMKFFVAKVNLDKVKKNGEKTMLSPLRFYYDSELFSLPIRLGLVNSSGTQDLIVNILAPGQRYEVANYKNVAIPTNLNVKNGVKEQFGSFYAALFDQTLRKHPKAVVTEYSWDASTCDPCPGPPLSSEDLNTLGGDVIGAAPQAGTPQAGAPRVSPPRRGGRRAGGGMVLTRLHTRYTRDALGDDLVFREARPLLGGREFAVDDRGTLEQGAKVSPDGTNNFQARYAIRYPWMGAINCKNPVRGVWGGPPGDDDRDTVRPATNLAFAPRKNFDPWPFVKTASPVEPSLLGDAQKVTSTMSQGLAFPPTASSQSTIPDEPPAEPPVVANEPPAAPVPPSIEPPRGGCAGCQMSPAASSVPALSLLLALLLRRRSRR
jgi:hypothetical protein